MSADESPAADAPPGLPATSAVALPPANDTMPIHSLVLDAGPLIMNDPPADTLRSRAGRLYTTPAVLAELRDAAARARVDTALAPFLTVRTPRPQSVAFAREFSRRTGDLEVLSRTDLQLIALVYEIEGERSGGAVRAAPLPVLQGVGAMSDVDNCEMGGGETGEGEVEEAEGDPEIGPAEDGGDEWTVVGAASKKGGAPRPTKDGEVRAAPDSHKEDEEDEQEEEEDLGVELVRVNTGGEAEMAAEEEAEEDNDGEDDDDWITPANLEEHRTRDASGAASTTPLPTGAESLGTALLTSDYAMQNVALRMGLAVVAPSLARITQLRTWVLRCHGCFAVCRDMTKQFCPRCGQANLIRASCSTDERGRLRIHLKRNMQWNNRGNVFSIPKPVHGTSSGKARGGGKSGWGQGLILAGDQKEYTREVGRRRRQKGRDLMDEDRLPGFLTGQSDGGGGGGRRILIGPGRGVNGRRGR